MIRLTAHDWDLMARTVYGEARGESFEGQTAVAWIICNRLTDGRFGKSIEEVCLHPKQFSCWNQDDPNRNRVLTTGDNDYAFQRAKGVTALVASLDLRDPTKGATHYYATELERDGRSPAWSDAMVTMAIIGGHRFLKEVA